MVNDDLLYRVYLDSPARFRLPAERSNDRMNSASTLSATDAGMFERTPLPRYAQVADALRNRIRRGAWKQDEAIPSIDRLMAEFGVGRVTVRQAIQILAREGLLSPEQGRGTFVTAAARQPAAAAGPDLARRPGGDVPRRRPRPRAYRRDRRAAAAYGGRAGVGARLRAHAPGAFARRGALLPRLHLRRPVGLRPRPGALPPRAGHPAAARTAGGGDRPRQTDPRHRRRRRRRRPQPRRRGQRADRRGPVRVRRARRHRALRRRGQPPRRLRPPRDGSLPAGAPQ